MAASATVASSARRPSASARRCSASALRWAPARAAAASSASRRSLLRGLARAHRLAPGGVRPQALGAGGELGAGLRRLGLLAGLQVAVDLLARGPRGVGDLRDQRGDLVLAGVARPDVGADGVELGPRRRPTARSSSASAPSRSASSRRAAVASSRARTSSSSSEAASAGELGQRPRLERGELRVALGDAGAQGVAGRGRRGQPPAQRLDLDLGRGELGARVALPGRSRQAGVGDGLVAR